MKHFNDLKFTPTYGGTKAYMTFPNGYGISVVCTTMHNSNGFDTYEVAVMKDGKVTYDTPITSDVLGWQDEKEVNDAMMQIQELGSNT